METTIIGYIGIIGYVLGLNFRVLGSGFSLKSPQRRPPSRAHIHSRTT